MAKNQKKDSNSGLARLVVFFISLFVCFSVAAMTLVKYQIVDADKYSKLAANINQTKQIIPAARGEIVDRNGKKLVTNVLNLSLVINREFPLPELNDSEETIRKKNQEGNQIILNLIEILDENGVNWEENSPITRLGRLEFKKDRQNEANKLKSLLSQQKYATAKDSIYLIVEKYNISGYNEKQTREIAMVRAMMLVKDFAYSGNFAMVEKIDPSFAGKIIEMKGKIKGISISETSTRQYISGDVAPHIIGNVGPIYAEEAEKYKSKNYALSDFVGKSGIESLCEDELRGQSGMLTVEKDADGNISNQYYEEGDEPKPGNTVKLTIDFELQKALQEALAAYTQAHSNDRARSKGAGLVVLDIKTGEVLAAVTYPYYDINTYNENYNALKSQSVSPLKNRALVELYRPGSTFKTFMSAAGLYTNTINPSTVFNCSDPFLDTQMGCLHHNGHHGPTTLYTALKWSCNHYFYNVARYMGIDLIDEYAPRFGFATDSGLELYNSDGRVTNPEYYRNLGAPYYVGYTYQTGIGQAEVYVTPLQMAICQMTIANKGTRYATHILKSIDKYDGSETLTEIKPQILSELSKENVAWETTIEGMKQMAQTFDSLSRLDIACKSGSPQYSDTHKDLFNAAAVGIYPASNPEIAMGLIIEDGDYATPFFSQLVAIYNQINQSRAQ